MMQNIEDYRIQMCDELQEFKGIFDRMIESLREFGESIAKKSGVTAKGELRLLNSPEYHDLEKAKKVIDVLANPSEVEQLFDNLDSDEVTFKIGAEIPLEELQDCTVAGLDYQVDGESIASVGIIGPQRMDYAKIASALKFVVGEFANLKQLDNTQKGAEDGQEE